MRARSSRPGTSTCTIRCRPGKLAKHVSAHVHDCHALPWRCPCLPAAIRLGACTRGSTPMNINCPASTWITHRTRLCPHRYCHGLRPAPEPKISEATPQWLQHQHGQQHCVCCVSAKGSKGTSLLRGTEVNGPCSLHCSTRRAAAAAPGLLGWWSEDGARGDQIFMTALDRRLLCPRAMPLSSPSAVDLQTKVEDQGVPG